ncbi:thioesterase II family protein [Streptomyces sp. NPDC047928]|uniref:thioesterase II family protein n=1 Tax=unclassified Streptomyces TaxID=2593676 RepID=UPI0037195219
MTDTSARTASPWLVNRTPRPTAPLRMYCFPHSGGYIGEFLRWDGELPEAELWGVQLPGRGARIDEPSHTALPSLVAELVEEAVFEPPFVFFGHSLGALLAYETARALRALGRTGPRRLILSACPAPHLPRTLPPLRGLGDRELFAAIQGHYGSLSAELAADDELLALTMSSHRADFTVVETYRHRQGPPLDIPFQVIGGTDDRMSADDLAQWRIHTQAATDVRLLPGGHFYLRDRRTDTLDVIRRAITLPAPAAPAPATIPAPAPAAPAPATIPAPAPAPAPVPVPRTFPHPSGRENDDGS